jgi:DNA phosphorothioation-associated putative methyltransferase
MIEFTDFRTYVQSIKVGKQLPDAVYLHRSALEAAPPALSALTQRIALALKIPDELWNVIKYGKRDFRITYLNYPQFDSYAYPSLHECFTVDLSKLSLRKADYSSSENPPILHRKETFVLTSHPLLELFESITREGEEAGLFENTRTIGFKKNWEKLIASKGLSLTEAGRLTSKAQIAQPLTTADITDTADIEIHRHKTAIDRNKLSQPMQILARHAYLNGDYSILDYGCGKGDDLRELEAHGIDVSGWDPVHNPEGNLINSDIVNLGFVLNVIDDRKERDETLRAAWDYAEKAIIASVMIAGETVVSQFTPFRDGVLTSRNTFQKYYSQGAFRNYLESVLEEPAIAVGQGIFLIFKDKIEEQNFLLERQHIRRDWKQRTERARKAPLDAASRRDYIDKHLELFNHFWETCLELGRVPANDEFELSDQIRRIAGSHAKALDALVSRYSGELLAEAMTKRKEDLMVYFALSLFGKRKPRTQMPVGLIRDIKSFFGSLEEAIGIATKELFQVGKNEVIESACELAFEKLQHGELIKGHSYIFHKDRLADMPSVLRIYIGCAAQLYGDLSNVQLIKAHMTSGKVSLMRYDDWNKSYPLLIERIKVNLRELEIDFFNYGDEYAPPPLENKDFFNLAGQSDYNLASQSQYRSP